MKTRTFLLAACLMCCTQFMQAQTEGQAAQEPQRPTQEQMNKMMATQKANELLLNEATANKFIPIYENYLTAMEELRGKDCKEKACCGPRPDGRKDSPRPEGKKEGKKDGKKGPRPEGQPGAQPGPQGQPAPDGQPAPEAKGQPCEGGACCGPKVMTDAEIEQSLKDRFDLLRKEADIQEKYYKELRSILTPLQIARVLDFGPREPQGPRK